jgi:hypothetical protein
MAEDFAHSDETQLRLTQAEIRVVKHLIIALDAGSFLARLFYGLALAGAAIVGVAWTVMQMAHGFDKPK